MKRLVLGSAFFCMALLVVCVEPTNAEMLYVANNNGNNITRFDASGTPTLFATTGVKGPADVAFDRSGNLYESNYTLGTVGRFAPDGTYLGVFASGGPQGPEGLAFDSHGNLFIANARGTIREISPTGVDLGVFASGLSNPAGLAFDKSDNLHVGFYDPNHHGVVREFSHSGTDLGVFASAGLQTPFSLVFDKSWNLYVGDLVANAVHRFSPTGADLGVLASGTSGDVKDLRSRMLRGHKCSLPSSRRDRSQRESRGCSLDLVDRRDGAERARLGLAQLLQVVQRRGREAAEKQPSGREAARR
jgi:streptogramin lyase